MRFPRVVSFSCCSLVLLLLFGCCGGFDLLRDAKRVAEQVKGYVDGVAGGLATVLREVRKVEQVLSEAVEEDCVFQCPKGQELRSNPHHTPTSNGCGSLGLQLTSENLPVAQLTDCCDDHDLCYDTCATDKDQCDLNFKKCLYKMCEKHTKKFPSTMQKTCKAAAKLLYTGTLALGCKSYMDAQRSACICQPQYGWKVRDDL